MLAIRKEDIKVEVEYKPNGEMDMYVTPVTPNGADCLNHGMELKGLSDIEGFLEWLIMSTVDEINETYPSNTEARHETRCDKEKMERFATKAICNSLNGMFIESPKLQ